MAMETKFYNRKKQHPKERAGFFSLATFAYILKFIYRERGRVLDNDDLYNIMGNLQCNKLGDALEIHWKNQKRKTEDGSIISALSSCYGKSVLILMTSNLATKIFYICTTPWALGKFVSYFEENQTHTSREEAVYLAIAMISLDFLNGLWDQHYILWKTELCLKIEGSISSIIYRKTMTFNAYKISQISTGKIVTAITKDVPSLTEALFFAMDLVSEVLQMVVVSILLYRKIGLAAYAGITIVVISMLIQVYSAKPAYLTRILCYGCSDRRLQQTREVLSSIKLIKMYRWEPVFNKKLMEVRGAELAKLRLVFVWRNLSLILGMISGRVVLSSTLLCQYFLGRTLNSDIVYYSTKISQKVSKSMLNISMAIDSISQFMMASTRINMILNAEETVAQLVDNTEFTNPDITFVKADIAVGSQVILKNINLHLVPGLNIITGPSGCGKSFLLKSILGEYNTTSGEVEVRGTVSYASQYPWIFPASVKQNVLFGQFYDEPKYKAVLDACGLTYDIEKFIGGDEMVVIDGGANLSGGQKTRLNLARALYKDSDIYVLDDCLASIDSHVSNHIFTYAIQKYLKGKLCLLVTHNSKFLNQADNIIIIDDGTIKYSGKYSEIPGALLENLENSKKTDVLDENIKTSDSKDNSDPKQDDLEDISPLLQNNEGDQKVNIYQEVKKCGKVSLDVYKTYFSYGGGLTMFLSIVLLHLICEASSAIGDIFVSKWLNNEPELYTSGISPGNLTEYLDINELSSSIPEFYSFNYFTLFVGASYFSAIVVVLRSFACFYFALRVSKNVHQSLVDNMLQATMTFFDSHLIGTILTRFSKDLFVLDGMIPYFLQTFRNVFILSMSILLIASVDHWFALMSLAVTITFFFLCEYLLSTTRNLQRLSTSSLGPVIGHVNTTLEGLVVVRAYGSQKIMRTDFDQHLNVYISANHLREISTRVLGLYSHFNTTVFTACIIFKQLFAQEVAAPGDIGLVLSQANMLCTFLDWSLLIWMWTENAMTNVERALEYTKIPVESPGGQTPENWPQKGEIEFRNVNFKYKASETTVLKNLNIKIKPQEKIGIVGRTGAGKSSIIVTLFKMYDFDGEICIDGINIKTISMECLRKNLAIIPQDPVIFTGTLRSNIDPLNVMEDSEVWSVLKEVNLNSSFISLDEDIMEKQLSIGQKQLICLARAAKKNTKIVILDEATANMDEQMDLFIQKKIRELFKACTVITVAHRLHTIMDSSRILVMDKGEVVEFDTPENLMSNNDSLFYKMVNP